MELAIGELAVVLDQSQPRVSRHVRILVEAGIVERRREGSWVFLRIIRGGAVGDILAHADDWPFSAREALVVAHDARRLAAIRRSEEHTSELQSLMRISYAVFCLNKKNNLTTNIHHRFTVKIPTKTERQYTQTRRACKQTRMQ